MIVRARRKAVEELPDWINCCEKMRTISEKHQGEILEVLLGTECTANHGCSYCGRLTENVKAIRLTSPTAIGGNAIMIDCYEFDEGVL